MLRWIDMLHGGIPHSPSYETVLVTTVEPLYKVTPEMRTSPLIRTQ